MKRTANKTSNNFKGCNHPTLSKPETTQQQQRYLVRLRLHRGSLKNYEYHNYSKGSATMFFNFSLFGAAIFRRQLSLTKFLKKILISQNSYKISFMHEKVAKSGRRF